MSADPVSGTKLHITIRPVDTFMFRDGRPFNQGDPGAAEAVSVFPPYPTTVSGMIRALLTRNGHPGNHLSISAPVVMSDKHHGAVYPMPRAILATGLSTKPYARLLPGAERACDLGKVQLPEPVVFEKTKSATDLTLAECQGAGLKDIEDGWLTREGLKTVLAGRIPANTDVVPRAELWQPEPRVGVGIDMAGADDQGKPISKLKERRPVDGALYAAVHTRLQKDVWLQVTVEALNGATLSVPQQFGPAGGEHRFAEFEGTDASQTMKLEIGDPPTLNTRLNDNGTNVVRVLLYHAAPCLLHPMPSLKKERKFGAVKTLRAVKTACLAQATVVSACLGKALMIGGWSLDGGKAAHTPGPVAMRPAIPAGSVWFLEAPLDQAAAIQKLHGQRIGENLGRGFGEIFIGTW